MRNPSARRLGTGKYRNVKVTLPNGEKFDSKKEARYLMGLEALRHANSPRDRIVNIRRQVAYELVPSQRGKVRNERSVTYKADFVLTFADGHDEVHDVKSTATKTKDYVIKRKLMKLVHGIEIVEV